MPTAAPDTAARRQKSLRLRANMKPQAATPTIAAKTSVSVTRYGYP
jgi:hypothetical protein